MDADDFDALSRVLSAGHTRRRLTRLLGGLSLGGALAALGLAEALAAKRIGGAPCTRNTQCQTGRCVGKTGHKTCSCSSALPTCKQPSNPCKEAVCNVETQRCVTRNGCDVGEVCRSMQCVACGDEGEPCCATNPRCEGSIDEGTKKTCHPVTKTCHLCAESVGSPCCPGNECYQPGVLVCEEGICQGAGGCTGKCP